MFTAVQYDDKSSSKAWKQFEKCIGDIPYTAVETSPASGVTIAFIVVPKDSLSKVTARAAEMHRADGDNKDCVRFLLSLLAWNRNGALRTAIASKP
jgi:hypothetical protein